MEREWTDQLEKQLQYLGNCCRGYIWMYKRDIQKFSKVSFWVKTGGIILGVLGGCLGVLAGTLHIEQTDIMIGLTAVFSFGASFCQGFLSQSKYDEKISDLKRQISVYSGLANNIRRQLGQSRHHRERAEDYHRWITEKYGELGQTCIDATSESIEQYKALCGVTGLPFPDDPDKESNIDIYKDSEEKDIDKKSSLINQEDKGNQKRKAKTSRDLTEAISSDDHTILDIKSNKDGNDGNEGTKTLKGKINLQGAFQFTDTQMQYELDRLQYHT